MRASLATWTAGLGGRLGRCSSCMRTSFTLAAFALLLAAAAGWFSASGPLLAAAALPALVLAPLAAAHAVAYAWRGPQRSVGCQGCAERARQHARRAFWRRLRARALSPLRRTPAGVRRAPGGGCTGCGRKTPLEEVGSAPVATPEIRAVLESWPEFQRVAPLLADAEPADTWNIDQLHHFVWRLTPDDAGNQRHALFVARWESDEPVTAVVVTADPAGGEPGVQSLRPAASPTPAT